MTIVKRVFKLGNKDKEAEEDEPNISPPYEKGILPEALHTDVTKISAAIAHWAYQAKVWRSDDAVIQATAELINLSKWLV